MSKPKWDFRDVSVGLKALRDFLMGRKHNLHGRFLPLLSPRSIPPPDIPRGPDYKYSNQYYMKRHAMNSVKPPVVAPVAAGPGYGVDPTKINPHGCGLKPDTLKFNCAPKPGTPWWWDGHCYYEFTPDPPKQPESPPDPCAPPPTEIPDPCATKSTKKL